MGRFRLAQAILAAAAASSLPSAQALEGHRIWHDGREITIVDQDGVAMYQGDIILGRTADVLARSRAEAPDGQRIGSIAKSVTVGVSGGRWLRGASGVYEMPYVVESDPDGSVPAAVQTFNQQLAGVVQAVPRTTQDDYVAFTLSASDSSGACSSQVGRVGGRQLIQGSRLCGSNTLVHEMGHAVGLWHEQEHPDRAAFIQFDLSALDPARASNFATGPNQRGTAPYDYASIMHYSATTFSKAGGFTMESIPAGVAIGSQVGFSAADVEGVRRMYAVFPERITVTSFPAGLTVIVDGASVTTPATFDWSIGSSHTIDVPGNVQVINGTAQVFARWNVDRTGDLAARRTVTVAPGDGSITSPANVPAVSTYTASFVRYKEVRLTAVGAGSINATPSPSTLPGVAGSFYRERQVFALSALPAAGAAFGNWNGNYFFPVAATTNHRNPFMGPVAFSDAAPGAYEYRANFLGFQPLIVMARSEAGEALGLRATVTAAGGTAGDQRLPYNAVAWAPGQSGTLAANTAPVSPFAVTMRYRFRDWDGDPSPTITVASPAAGAGASRVVTANFTKEYQAFKQVIPLCAGTMTLPGDPNGWYAHGSSLPITLQVAQGWTFLGWEGSLGGTSLTPTLPVSDWPNLVARFNTTNAPLAITSISPDRVNAGGAVPITIDGTGFTPSTEVYVGSNRQPSQFVSPTRVTATLAAANMPLSGNAIVTVTNRSEVNLSCLVSATKSIDVIGLATAAVTPQTGWWWNANESGRGFFIEKLGNNVFMAGYLYEADGRATWFTAGGPMSGSSFSADMIAFRGGQTLSGAYVAPTQLPVLGRVTLDFTAPDRATMTWPSGTTAITRYVFGSGASPQVENGWWWNAGEAGRGYSIEVSGNTLFMVGFMYDAAGNPVWYLAQGTFASGTMVDRWQQFANGQSLTGAYRAPIALNSNVGPLTISFANSRAATLTMPDGRQVALTRFAF